VQHKLITIYMTEAVDEDLGIQDHLSESLDNGWRVVSITPLGQGGRRRGGVELLVCRGSGAIKSVRNRLTR
jgi:hypothetical protein